MTNSPRVGFEQNSSGAIINEGTFTNPEHFTENGEKGNVNLYFLRASSGAESSIGVSYYTNSNNQNTYTADKISVSFFSHFNFITINTPSSGKISPSDGAYIFDTIINGFLNNDTDTQQGEESAWIMQISNADAQNVNIIGNKDVLAHLNYVMNDVRNEDRNYDENSSYISANSNSENGYIKMIASIASTSREMDLANSLYSVNANDLGVFTRNIIDQENKKIASIDFMDIRNASFSLKNSIGSFNTTLVAQGDVYNMSQTYIFLNTSLQPIYPGSQILHLLA